jgi:hypothetical protein
MRTALTIAGSDSGGGAGIQADIKTMTANGVYAMSAVTALTAQNTTGVTDIMEVTPEFLAKQLDAVFTDIFPDAVKTGMVSCIPLPPLVRSNLVTLQTASHLCHFTTHGLEFSHQVLADLKSITLTHIYITIFVWMAVDRRRISVSRLISWLLCTFVNSGFRNLPLSNHF